ncbi:MAG: hypothetical protein GX379_04890 [Clostridiales bacterium]|jgi:hypothetical protein|nr:hypothetical protein [Clostridiales bacterium]
MPDFVKEWFSWFEKGIEQVDQKEKEKLFSVCGMHCAETGVIKLYKDIYDKSCNNLDTFFGKFEDMKYVKGKVITPGKVYEIIFPDCYCDLYTKGYVHTDSICECSRQSILYVLKTLNSENEYEVEKLSTVISGDKECRFRVTIV